MLISIQFIVFIYNEHNEQVLLYLYCHQSLRDNYSFQVNLSHTDIYMFGLLFPLDSYLFSDFVVVDLPQLSLPLFLKGEENWMKIRYRN